jgi:hypothetical protein
MTEDEVLQSIETAASALTRFKFGPHDEEDIKQQGTLFALEALEAGSYDPRPGPDGKPTRPLVNFLYTHIRNRLTNFKRNQFKRTDPPCRSCHECLPGRTEHPDGQYCPKYEAWLKRNIDKANILCPLDISDHEGGFATSEVEQDVATQELLRLIDRKLPVELRSAYLQMRDGQQLPKATRDRVEEAVRDIIKESFE